jgi:hypothetical protein
MTDFRTELEHAAQELELAENALLCSSFHNSAIRVKAAARRARTALAQPEPQADGEVAELVAWLRDRANSTSLAHAARRITRAADLLERLAQPEPQGPTDEKLLELMPETMRDEFSYAARTCSDAMGGRVKPGIFRVALNTAALEYAQAVLQRYGRPAIEPVPVAERLPGPEDCDAKGRCWMCGKVDRDWRLISIDNPGVPQLKYAFSHWLPHWALPVPQQEAE